MNRFAVDRARVHTRTRTYARTQNASSLWSRCFEAVLKQEEAARARVRENEACPRKWLTWAQSKLAGHTLVKTVTTTLGTDRTQ